MLIFLHLLCLNFLDFVYFVSSINYFWNMAQKANNYIVMARYNGADLGELHIRFSLILRSLLLPAP